MQLSLFKVIPQYTTPSDIYTFNLNTPNPKQAAKLRELAASMQQSINNKLNPAINKHRATKRRKTIAQGIIAEGMELQTIQSWLLVIAEMWFVGNIPEVLRGISQKSQVEALYKISQRAKTLEEVKEIVESEYYLDGIKSFNRASIYTAGEIMSAIAEIQKVVKPEEVDNTQQELNRLELEIIGMKSGDFFPTPSPVCDRLIQLAEINETSRILDPSTGSGCIAESILKKHPQIDFWTLDKKEGVA